MASEAASIFSKVKFYFSSAAFVKGFQCTYRINKV